MQLKDCSTLHCGVRLVAMKMKNQPITHWVLCAILGFPSLAKAWLPGIYPVAPLRMTTSGFSVNNQDRNDVIAFWHAVYRASDGYETRIGWTGNYSGNYGTVSSDFVDDMERRLNYFRAMCGVHSNAVVNSGATVLIGASDAFKPAVSTLKSTACQAAALMLVRNYSPSTGADPALSHNPPSNIVGWSTSAWNANAHGNFAFGLYGPGAMTEYIAEGLSNSISTSTWNSLVGHRRWCLFPGSTDFATGDQPGTSAFVPPTNVFYVLPKATELVDTKGQGFVIYPPAGFFPANLNSKYWSVSLKGADFTTAAVTMTDANGVAAPITSLQINSGFGDPAIIWQVSPTAAVQSVTADTTYFVNVTGISGTGIPTSLNYSVTLINPYQLLSNQSLSGPVTLASNITAKYAFSRPIGAEVVQVGAFLKNSTAWIENAEIPANAQVIDYTAASYPLIVKPSSFAGFGSVSGINSFRLTFPTSYDPIARGIPEQFFQLNRNIIAKANAKLNFKYRRGYMTKGSNLVVETSADEGATWNALGTPIIGVSDTNYDIAVSSASLPLTPSTSSVRVRFRYFTTGGAVYTLDAAPAFPTGIFIDDITTTQCESLDLIKTNSLTTKAKNFAFKAATAGKTLIPGAVWQLKLRTQLGGKFFPFGPGTSVTITAP